MVATGFRNSRQLDTKSAAKWLRHVLDQLKKNDGKYRGLSAAAKGSWNRLLQYNRLDCEGLQHVYERATRELGLEQAYLHTTFHVNVFGEKVVRPGRRVPDLEKALSLWPASRWAIITAYTPQSRVLSDVENTERNIALKRRVNDLMSFSALGVGSVGDWTPEPSLLVLGISRGKAVALGREFGQAAIVVGTRGERAELVWCNTLDSRARRDA